MTACVVAAAASTALPSWSPALLSSGAYKYASTMTGDTLDVSLVAGRLLYYRDGAMATVAVRDAAGTTSLAIDGKVDASNAGDMLTQRLLAHVPLLLHPAPRGASPSSASAAASPSARRSPPARARRRARDLAGSRARPRASSSPRTAARWRDPRVRLMVGDGRTHLLLARDQYDVIVSEPSNPWMAGIAVALHPRVLRRGAGPGWRPAACCVNGRTPTTSAPTTCVDRRAPSPPSSPTARCGWSATATSCWWAAPSR